MKEEKKSMVVMSEGVGECDFCEDDTKALYSKKRGDGSVSSYCPKCESELLSVQDKYEVSRV